MKVTEDITKETIEWQRYYLVTLGEIVYDKNKDSLYKVIEDELYMYIPKYDKDTWKKQSKNGSVYKLLKTKNRNVL